MRLDKCKMKEFVHDLRTAYDESVNEAGEYLKHTKKITLLERATHKPAKSFYVSLEEGIRMIHCIEKNGVSGVGKNNPLTALKYNDLYRVYQKLRAEKKGCPDLAIIAMAVEAPAPRFYIKPYTAYLILNKFINI